MKNEELYKIVGEKEYNDGDIIFQEDSSDQGFFLIISGSVEISRNIQGRRYVIQTLNPGEICGEMELFGGMECALTARAIGKTTLGVIDCEPFESEYVRLSGQFRSILESIPIRLKKMLDRASDLSE